MQSPNFFYNHCVTINFAGKDVGVGCETKVPGPSGNNPALFPTTSG